MSESENPNNTEQAEEIEKKEAQNDTQPEELAKDNEQTTQLEPEEEQAPPPVDGRVDIEVANVKMEVYLMLLPPENGGREMTLEDVHEALEREKVVYGINESRIVEMIEKKQYDVPVLIAEATPPEHGADGYIVKHFEDGGALKPREREDGTVDFRDLGLITNVTKGTEICDIVEATEGTPGTNVLGEEVAAKPGRPPRVPQGTNTGLSGDGLKLLALADGNLVFSGGTYKIEPIFTIRDDVGVATGNIDFIGEVVVTENVGEGYSVKAKGNITVRGMVYGATIEAGGNIIIKNGALNAKLTAGGNIEVKFSENSTIEGKGNLKADSLIGCTINIQGELTATGQPGSLMGGTCVATKNITANYIGSKSYTHTSITIGDFALLAEEKRQLEVRLEEIDQEILRLDQAITYLTHLKQQLGALPPEREDILKAAKNTKVQRSVEKNPILRRSKEIEESMQSKSDLCVTANKILYPNVRIAICNTILQVDSEYNRCKVIVDEGEASIKML